MQNRNEKAVKLPWKYRAPLVLSSLLVIILGIGRLLRGNVNYENWWGGLVFAPVAIVIGLIVLLVAVFKPNTLQISVEKKKSRIRGWPTGKARYYRDRN